MFGELTGGNVDNDLCIMLDNQAVSYANIEERISQTCRISGRFSRERVQDLVRTLDAGSLPARLMDTPLSEKTIGPSLGETNRLKGIRAAAWAGGAVAIFVLIYYGIAAGGMANVALVMNMLFVLGIMALLQATFTLPGIAGIVLTVGMAVDANVLIFERIREELRRGKKVIAAIDVGYSRALSTIIDANVTTLIAALILFQSDRVRRGKVATEPGGELRSGGRDRLTYTLRCRNQQLNELDVRIRAEKIGRASCRERV